jgi:hypothetical protein
MNISFEYHYQSENTTYLPPSLQVLTESVSSLLLYRFATIKYKRRPAPRSGQRRLARSCGYEKNERRTAKPDALQKLTTVRSALH